MRSFVDGIRAFIATEARDILSGDLIRPRLKAAIRRIAGFALMGETEFDKSKIWQIHRSATFPIGEGCYVVPFVKGHEQQLTQTQLWTVRGISSEVDTGIGQSVIRGLG